MPYFPLAAYDAHSGDWLNVLPLPKCGLLLDNEVIRISVALLVVHMFSMFEDYGQDNLNMNLLNDIVWCTLTPPKMQSVKEPLSLENSGRKPDGASLIPWQRGRCVTWDVTFADTYAKSYIGQTSSCVGAAAERAASRKVEKYNFLRDTYFFIPLACETTGV